MALLNDENMNSNNSWKWEILNERQDNGLWGMPLQCYKADSYVMGLSEENWLKHSALCMGIAEAYKDETFEIFFSNIDGFYVKLSESGMKRINYTDYELNGNILTWIGKQSINKI